VNNKIYKYHQYANLFPLLEGEDYNNLKEDIKKNGLLEPIYLYKDEICDGRNRYRCCIDLGIKPIFRLYEGKEEDLLSFILSLNLHRRHLSESQRSIIAAKLANLDIGRPASNLIVSIATVSQSDAAAALDVSRVSVNRANRVLNRGSEELVDLVESGKLGVLPASEVATLDEQDQETIIARGEAEILAVAKEIRNRNKNDLMFSSDEQDWKTPESILKLVYKMFGNDFLDPCASTDNSHIKCKLSFNKFDDGLNKSWSDYKVYLNPPYGITIKYWIDKILSENLDEAILLLPARTDTHWFRKLSNYPVCFINGRLKFSNHLNSAPFPSMVVYIGKRENKFKTVFSAVGQVYKMVK
jgi:phage N-6-adenine-methyltransferase